MQAILGAGGAIGRGLAKELKKYTNRVRLVSRKPKKVNDDDELFAADLTNKEAVLKAVEGCDVVYLVAGLPYKLKVWQQQWPQVMQNVLEACKHNGAKLVFFDNIYAYDVNSISHMTEDAPLNPPSKKGQVRAAIAQMLLNEVSAKNINAMIIRAADFYGPNISGSMLLETVYKNLKKGKAAYWLGDASKIHSFTYTPDAAKATALLGNTPDAFNQVWHAPTSDEKLTGKELVQLFAENLSVKPKVVTFSTTLVKLVGFFNPLMKELSEMLYQNVVDYYFDSSKFKKRFPEFKVTSYKQGVQQIIAADQK